MKNFRHNNISKVMSAIRATIISLCILVNVTFAYAAGDSKANTIGKYLASAIAYSRRVPQEKVYIHFDNTSYYHHDKIWFSCYVVDAATNRRSNLSKTLYVELLTPGGEIIAKRILRVKDGMCHGDFTLNHKPFYSGYYEIRAYTRYMMNFGDAAVFSRVFPIFDSPQKDGDYADRRMMRPNSATARFGSSRPASEKNKTTNMRFYPEGGHIVAGLPARVAFEITADNTFPDNCSGQITDGKGTVITDFRTEHEGKGTFCFTPQKGTGYKAVITHNDKQYTFDLPEAEEEGIVMNVDNITSPDTVTVKLMKTSGSYGITLGIAFSSRGKIYSYGGVELDSVAELKISKHNVPSGVYVVTAFDPSGKTIADRMIFVNNGGYSPIDVSFDKESYSPQEKVTMSLCAADSTHTPEAQTLSVAVRDADNEVEYQSDILSDLLLMSEIKGYVRNPSQYFSTSAAHRDTDLDLLMMTQGWRRYPWEMMSGVKASDIRYFPEQGIEVNGRVVSFVKSVPKPGVKISTMLTQKNPTDSTTRMFMDNITTDSCGNFYLTCDIDGRWHLIMTVTEKGKKKDHRIIFDRLFSPTARRFAPYEMKFDIADSRHSPADTVSETGTNTEETYTPVQYSEKELTDDGDIQVNLREVVVTGKHNSREAAIQRQRSKAVAYYDVASELDKINDKGAYVGQNMFSMLSAINPNFSRQYTASGEEILYKSRKVLFVIDYATSYHSDSLDYQHLYLESIKSMYINEEPGIKLRYADPKETIFTIDRYGCAVFIETDPNMPAPPGKGTRRTMVEGYSIPSEFYVTDYSIAPEEDDYRRTLYWNPELKTDENGKATVEFYNNSSCRNIKVSAAGISDQGKILTTALPE